MAYLIDTCVLVRLANAADALHAAAADAVLELHRRGETLNVTAQNLAEFRSVATRPAALNGLGLASVDVEAKAAEFKLDFLLLPETPDIFLRWKALVEALSVVGKQVYDARLVAVCHTHQISHLLTFNEQHFRRLAGFGAGVTVVDARAV